MKRLGLLFTPIIFFFVSSCSEDNPTRILSEEPIYENKLVDSDLNELVDDAVNKINEVVEENNSNDNFPKELVGEWNCDCIAKATAETSAEEPPSLIIKGSPDGYEVWFARSSGLIKSYQKNGNSYNIKYDDRMNGVQGEIDLQLIGGHLTINGYYKDQSWCSNGMERCSIPPSDESWYH
jgi:hypothetical protein